MSALFLSPGHTQSNHPARGPDTSRFLHWKGSCGQAVKGDVGYKAIGVVLSVVVFAFEDTIYNLPSVAVFVEDDDWVTLKREF